MCDWHSTAWRMLGQDIQCAHKSNNSHAESIEEAGWRSNEPNRKIIVFEAELSVTKDAEIPEPSKFIRNFGECPEQLVRAIVRHYKEVKKALTTGKNLSTHFADAKTWCDVWNAAIKAGAEVVLPEVFGGNLAVYGSAKLDAPLLKEVGGNLDVYDSAKLDAPLLKEVGGNLAVYGSAKLDAPLLKEVGGKPYSNKQ